MSEPPSAPRPPHGVLDLTAVREDYQATGLHRADLADDPLDQFRAWYADWEAVDPFDPAAVALATATPDGRPSVRFVLVRRVDHGFCFFTDTTSRKGEELAANPQAALCFGWIPLSRQVRAVGPVERLSDAEVDAYWEARPHGSRVSAVASAQSQPIADRAALETRRDEVAAAVGDGPVERPEGWGGYRLTPDEVEVWQGRADRLHDRFLYTRAGDGWAIQRLMP
ncbi:pyridoxamine 5'-phosphate oxidase [Iamia sp. SCSIO 61187]|uniref:pyridoxamine 5'-phosphate oxidase n=1 Tax=Iamia sp. SCSIO 61187 TaxID=2722752 RepID=UPI001C62F22F|nr:pyridoxamine 5'-phosphate oxidase [Iamia sp. SCSIO 61187]QYG91117.1 pyridoxamine 5'-phosphate oxidase [Iamia sp. SCSIO 61187]